MQFLGYCQNFWHFLTLRFRCPQTFAEWTYCCVMQNIQGHLTRLFHKNPTMSEKNQSLTILDTGRNLKVELFNPFMQSGLFSITFWTGLLSFLGMSCFTIYCFFFFVSFQSSFISGKRYQLCSDTVPHRNWMSRLPQYLSENSLH